MRSTNTSRRLASLACAAIAATPLFAQTSYEWNDPASGGVWSNFLKWDPLGGPGSTFPGGTDSAHIPDATADRTITYDSSSPGTLTSLSLTQTSAFTSTLSLEKSLSIANGVTLGATGGGTSLLRLTPTGTSQILLTTPTLAVNSGGHLLLGSGTSNTGTSRVDADVTINSGGTLTLHRGPSSATTFNAYFGGALTINSGSTLTLFPGASGSSTDNRINVVGNFTAHTGATNIVSGQNWQLIGAVNTMTGSYTPGSGFISLFAPGDQSLKATGGVLGSVTNFRGTGDAVKTVGSIDPAVTLTVGEFKFGQATAGATTTLKLASNITHRQFGTMPGLTAVGNVNGGRYAVDVNGFTWDVTNTVASSANRTLVAAGASNNTSAHWTYTNTSETHGKIRAGAFNLNGTNLAASSVGPNITLEANGTGTSLANNLGGPSGTIDATSVFRYTGTATTATLTSNRTIGGLAVANGQLTLVTAAITAAGDVSVGDTTAGVGTLNLGGQNLVLSGSANLSGVGTLTDTVGSGVVSFADGATGGLAIGNNGVGTLTFSGTLGGLDLTHAATSTFEIAGLGSFDSAAMGGITLTYGGSLALTFLDGYAPAHGDTFALFTGLGSVHGSFGTITSNITGFDFSFDAAAGVLSVSAVPEPAASAALLGAGAVGLALFRRRRPLGRAMAATHTGG